MKLDIIDIITYTCYLILFVSLLSIFYATFNLFAVPNLVEAVKDSGDSNFIYILLGFFLFRAFNRR